MGSRSLGVLDTGETCDAFLLPARELRVEWDPPSHRDSLVAAASLDDDARTSAAVAEVLGVTSAQVGSYRARLLAAGLLRPGPAGTIQFTLPGLRRHLRSA